MKEVRLKINGQGLTLHYLTVVGSKAHGLNDKYSDTDIKGVFTWDKKELCGLHKVEESLEKNKFSEDNWNEFIAEFEKTLSIKLDDSDDLVLFEVRQFCKLGLKSDLNLLDMLFSEKPFVLFESEAFKILRNENMSFLNFEFAKSRFKGLSSNVVKEMVLKKQRQGKEVRNKDLAKALQGLLSLKEMFKEKMYKSRLGSQNLELLMSVKNGKYSISEVLDMHNEFMAEVEALTPPINPQLNPEYVSELCANVYLETKN